LNRSKRLDNYEIVEEMVGWKCNSCAWRS